MSFEQKFYELGLRLSDLKGKKVLQLGTGHSPEFVRYLRGEGVDAEGVDETALDQDFFMNSLTNDPYPTNYQIPAESAKYDIVFAHFYDNLLDLNPTQINFGKQLGYPINDIGTVRKDIKDKVHAIYIVTEALRVLNPESGVMSIFPAFTMSPLENVLKTVGFKHDQVVASEEHAYSVEHFNSGNMVQDILMRNNHRAFAYRSEFTPLR